MSFRLKTVLGIAGIEIILLSILIVSSLHYLRISNEQQLMDWARTTAKLVATMTSDAVVAMDIDRIDVLINQTIKNPGIDFVRVRLANGTVVSESGNPSALRALFAQDSSIASANRDGRLDVRQLINVGGEEFGSIEIGFDIGAFDLILRDARQWMLSLAGLEIVLVGIFGLILGRISTRQLMELQKGAQRVADGDLGHSIFVRGNDELSETAKSFNQMSRALAAYAGELETAKEAAEAGRDRAESVLHDGIQSLSQGVMIVNENGAIVLKNNALDRLYPDVNFSLPNIRTLDAFQEAVAPFVDQWRIDNEGRPIDEPFDYKCAPERWLSCLTNGRRVLHTRRPMISGGTVFVETDVSPIYEAQEKILQLERELMQSQKMEALGTLAGGIAHEINTPIQYIGDNLRFLEESTRDLLAVLDVYKNLSNEAKAQNVLIDQVEVCENEIEEKDVEFLREEAIQAAEQSIDGVKQVSDIVLAMKEFSHPAHKDAAPVDLNRVLERSSVVCKSEWRQAAELIFDIDESLPAITGHEGALNQVALNLIVNAAHAIQYKGPEVGTITLRTRHDGESVRLEVEDSGTGISENIRDQIFEPFFTTKDVGRGTGQGLALVHDIVVNKHGGWIGLDSSVGIGTTVIVKLPIKKQNLEAAEI